MVIVMKPSAPQKDIDELQKRMEDRGLTVHISQGVNYCLLGLVGETNQIDTNQLEAHEHVDRVVRVQHPFKLASRMFHPQPTVVDVGGVKVGGGHTAFMAGPCAVENEEQVMEIAHAIKDHAQILRGGTFKPRTSPYSFQGLEEEGLRLLRKAGDATGMPIVTEVMSPEDVDLVAGYTDMLQIGARNMQNFPLLRRVGRAKTPVLLKRGMSATIEDLLMSAEYIMSEGNIDVILCERGIRTFETYTRNTLDISAVPSLQELTHLPVIVDPSHACGKWTLVAPLARAAVAAGVDGLIIEVHHQPEKAMSDGAQSLKPHKYKALVQELRQISELMKSFVVS